MSLELNALTKAQAEMLAADGWTVEKLAGTDVFTLEKYPTIGKATARRIIDEAQELTVPIPEPTPEAPPEAPPVSVKVKRIRDGMNQ